MIDNAARKIRPTIVAAIAVSCFGASAISVAASLAAASVPAVAAFATTAPAASPSDINWG